MRTRALGIPLALALVAGGPPAAEAAFPTEVRTAAEPNNIFDLDLSLGFDHARKGAKITREWIQDQDGTLTPLEVRELTYTEVTQRLLLDLRIGVFRDLEIHIGAPIILANDSSIGFQDGVLGRSTICCEGDQNADDPAVRADPRYPFARVPSDRYRSGFGDMVFGLAWSPFVDAKDEAYPTLTLRADVTTPTGRIRDPSDVKALVDTEGGGVGRGMTVFDLSLAVSRRMQLGVPALDPYMIFGARIPVANPSQKAKGMEPAASGRFMVGAELLVWEDVEAKERFALDLAFQTRYVGTGRTYSELSDYLPSFDPTRVLGNRTEAGLRPDEFAYSDFDDPRNYAVQREGTSCGKIVGVPCGELNKVDDYLQLKGTATLNMRFAEYVLLRAGFALEHETDHFLTNERVGKDLDPSSASSADCDGAACVGRVNARNSYFDRTSNTCPAGQTCDERSQYYDPRYDALGRRLRIEDVLTWTIFVSGAATF